MNYIKEMLEDTLSVRLYFYYESYIEIKEFYFTTRSEWDSTINWTINDWKAEVKSNPPLVKYLDRK